MSNTTDYTVSNAVYEQARTDAKARAAKQWSDWSLDPKSAHMWKTYNTELNPDWVDPWYESETSGIYNGPSTGPGDPAYEMTQNLYMAYCWLMYKGYNKYSAMALMLSAIQESTITGGMWEAANHPYSSLIGYDPTSVNENGYNYTWYHGGTKPAYDNGQLVTWTASWTPPVEIDYGPYNGYTWYKTADPGSWNAVKRWEILKSRQMVPGVGSRIMPVGWETDELQWDTSQARPDGRGYGFCQWTPWTKLPVLCSYAASHDNNYFIDGNKHWQVNASLQLMVWEYERYLSMTTPQAGGSYLGQWIDSNAAIQGDYGAYFSWPYPGTVYTRHYYGQSISWDDFAAGTYLTWFDNYIQNMTDPPVAAEDVDWCRRQLALGIYRSCFLQALYADFNFQTKSLYIISAFNYWADDWDVKDIPRARDIPNFELDKYHLSNIELITTILRKRRRQPNVRTLLL